VPLEHIGMIVAAPSPESSRAAPPWTLLLPVAYVAHLCEEWWGGPGFSAWASTTLGANVSQERFLLINAVALPAFIAGSIAAVRSSRYSWAAAALATIFLLNGALHLLATLAFATYSPGTITGAVLYLPLGAFVLVVMARLLTLSALILSVVMGIGVHVAVAVAAFA
jgi:hypothetical protein